MRQICNLGYAMLIENKTPAQIAQLDVLLTPPEEKGKAIEDQNIAAMKELEARMGGTGALIMPPRRPPKKD